MRPLYTRWGLCESNDNGCMWTVSKDDVFEKSHQGKEQEERINVWKSEVASR